MTLEAEGITDRQSLANFIAQTVNLPENLQQTLAFLVARRVIWGDVADDGTLSYSNDDSVTVSKGSTGEYTLLFDPAFSAQPHVGPITLEDNRASIDNDVTYDETQAGIEVRDNSGAKVDERFLFLIVGTR